MPIMTEVLIRDADGEEFPILFPGHAPTTDEDRRWIEEEALRRLRMFHAEGHINPREPLEVVSVTER